MMTFMTGVVNRPPANGNNHPYIYMDHIYIYTFRMYIIQIMNMCIFYLYSECNSICHKVYQSI